MVALINYNHWQLTKSTPATYSFFTSLPVSCPFCFTAVVWIFFFSLSNLRGRSMIDRSTSSMETQPLNSSVRSLDPLPNPEDLWPRNLKNLKVHDFRQPLLIANIYETQKIFRQTESDIAICDHCCCSRKFTWRTFVYNGEHYDRSFELLYGRPLRQALPRTVALIQP